MTAQPKALRLAEILKEDALLTVSHSEIAYELERQHAEIVRLQSQLKTVQCEAKMLHDEANAKHAEIERLKDEVETVRAAMDGQSLRFARQLAVNAGLLEALKWIELVFTDDSLVQERDPELWLPSTRAAISKAEKT